jgi:acetoin utilization deacetylase AcuC-like enzyme
MKSKIKFYIPDYGYLSDTPLIKRNVLLAERIKDEGIGEVCIGRNATDEDVLLFHTNAYIEALRTGYPSELADSGQPWYETIYEDRKKCAGAVLDAIDESLRNGVSGALCLSGHHAMPYKGGAISVLNDIGIGILYAKTKVNKVLMLDLDMHFSNGTTSGISNVKDIFLFDYHGHASHFFHPDTLHLFRNLSEEPYGSFYLNMLRKELPSVIDQFQPNLCIYLSGMDVYKGSSNAKLFLTERDILLRENLYSPNLQREKFLLPTFMEGDIFQKKLHQASIILQLKLL